MTTTAIQSRTQKLVSLYRQKQAPYYARQCVLISFGTTLILLAFDDFIFGDVAKVFRPYRIGALALLTLFGIILESSRRFVPRLYAYFVPCAATLPLIGYNLLSHWFLTLSSVPTDIVYIGNLISLVLSILFLHRFPRWQAVTHLTSLIGLLLVIANGGVGVTYAKTMLLAHGLFAMAAEILRRQFSSSLLEHVLIEEKTLEQWRLAAAVQNLMLPTDEQRTWKEWQCGYRYEACEQLAGDWLYFWECRGKLNVFLGDVVGKGAEAALVGAAIISCLDQAKKRMLNFEEAVLCLNECLIDIFRFGFTSTLAGLEIDNAAQKARYLHAGAPGWFLMSEQGTQILLAPHTPLGVRKNLQLQILEVPIPPHCTFVAFTDGVLETSREMNRVKKTLQGMRDVSGGEMGRVLFEMGREKGRRDDRTLVYLQNWASSKNWDSSLHLPHKAAE